MIKNLHEFYTSRCEEYSECFLFDNSITYKEAGRLAMGRAAFLQSQGLGVNDVIGLLAPSSAEWCITYMAVTAIGAIILPLDTNLPHDSYDPMLETAEAKALFVSSEFSQVTGRLPLFDLALDSCIDHESGVELPDITDDHIASIVFTSGTTGQPKIVSLSHRNIFCTAVATSEFLELTPDDLLLCLLPLFHVYALDANFIGPFAAGSALVFQPSLKGPDIMQSLADNPVTIFPAAPQLWELFMDGIINKVKAESAGKYRLFMFFLNNARLLRMLGLSFLVRKVFSPVHDIFGRSHRFFISGGAPLKRKYADYYRNMGFTLIEGYGLTETTGPISLPDYRKNVIGSVGRPTKGNHVRIKKINSDGYGEIWLKGDSVMPGYYRNEEANRQAFDEDGFFNTGDLGRLDSKGNIFITGRSKNVIVLDSGKNVYPEELESWYKRSDKIEEIAVFGKRINYKETVFAVIVPVEKNDESFSVIKKEIDELNRGLPDYKTARRFALSFDPLPVNSTRKVLYSEVEKLLESGALIESEGAAPAREELSGTTPRERAVVDLLKKRLGEDVLYTTQSLSDFGIDSLGMIDLVVFLEEELGVSIETKSFIELTSLRAVVDFLLSREDAEGSVKERIFSGDLHVRAHRFHNPVPDLILALISLVSRVCWKFRVINRQYLRPENSIIVANHVSFLDAVWILMSIPLRFRKDVYIIAKDRFASLRYFFPFLKVIFIEMDSISSVKMSADMLRQGKSLIIFPEGYISVDGQPAEFKNGAAYLAKHFHSKIVPVTINGAHEIYPLNRKLPIFITGYTAHLHVGEPIDPDAYSTVRDLNEEMHRAVRVNLSSSKN